MALYEFAVVQVPIHPSSIATFWGHRTSYRGITHSLLAHKILYLPNWKNAQWRVRGITLSVLSYLFMVFNNVILQTSTSVKQTLTCAVDAICNNTHGSFNCTCKPGYKTDGKNYTGNIHFSVWSVRMASKALCLFSVCLFDSFSFVSLTTYFVCSYKRTSVGLPFSRQLIGIHRANLAYYHWCSTMISDIDECELEAHNCSSNAICNNTKRSYNCTCKPAYEGDGNNCTVNFFRKFVLFADHRKHCRFYFSMIRCSL